jgi:putative transposase
LIWKDIACFVADDPKLELVDDFVAREAYHSDLTNPPWEILELLVPGDKDGGRPRDVDMREVINTTLNLIRTGCQWDMLACDL